MPNTNIGIYTLGLDIGIASVGAALITDSRIAGLHVRTFNKAETAEKGEPLNLTRRQARLTRRRIRRRAYRLLRLCRLMRSEGIIEKAAPDSFHLPGSNPWSLRAKGLDHQLELKEWATVLYHIIKHRGFQSTRKSDAATDIKAGQMLQGVAGNKALMQKNNYRTVGEMAAQDATFVQAKRNKGGDYSHTFDRSDLLHEIKELFLAQRRLGNAKADFGFEQKVHDLLMARRPALSGENLLKMVGKCTFEPQEFRAPKASYSAERFIWLGKLNNLKLSCSGELRTLNEEERKLLINIPFTQTKVTFKQIRKLLDLEENIRFNMISYRTNPKEPDKDPENVIFYEAKSFNKLRSAYEKSGLKTQWQSDSQNADKLNTISYALTCFKDDTEGRRYLSEHGIDAAITEAVLNESFDKFINISQKALHKILPYMEQGQRYDQAVESAGYNLNQTLASNLRTLYLPAPDKDLIRNPVVYRALNQARKLINAIIKEYGSPANIHIELARDLSKSFDERKKIENDQNTFKENRQKSRKDFTELFGSEANGLDLQKWLLYKEQGGQCAYSQRAIDLNRLLEPGYVEVDHILPYSRSYDDSQNNKSLVLTNENRNKGNRTPYEYLDGASDSDRWKYFEAWVLSSKGIRQAKRGRLLRKNFTGESSNEFRDRNLNDTRYICREFKNMLEKQLLWHPASQAKEKCVVLSGQLTALLRARWGLIKIRLNGDLHHAMDAAVIAAANRGLIKRMSDFSRRRELSQIRDEYYLDPETGEITDLKALRQIEEKFPKPWGHFREELEAWLSPDPVDRLTYINGYTEDILQKIEPVRVSRALLRRGLGSAHQEKIRSVGKDQSLLKNGTSSLKVPLTSLKLTNLAKIAGADDPRNASLIEAIKKRLEQFNGDGSKAFAAGQPPLFKPSNNNKTSPVIRSIKLIDTQKSGIQIRMGIAANGDMLRIDIFTKNKKYYTVPLYVTDTVRPTLPNRAVVSGKPESEWLEIDDSYKFCFSLSPNDWVQIKTKDSTKVGYYSKFDRANGVISLWTHDRNTLVGEEGLQRIGIKTAISVEKFHVDMLGRLYQVRQETRMALRLIKKD